MSDYGLDKAEPMPLFDGMGAVSGQGRSGKIARDSDPLTSHAAAAEIRGRMNDLQAEFVRRLARANRPLTAQEVAQGQESLRKRATECFRNGWIRKAGARRCCVTGKVATVFEVSR